MQIKELAWWSNAADLACCHKGPAPDDPRPRSFTRCAGDDQEIFAPHSHDAADSVDDTLESTAAGIRTVKISLLVLGLTALIRL